MIWLLAFAFDRSKICLGHLGIVLDTSLSLDCLSSGVVFLMRMAFGVHRLNLSTYLHRGLSPLRSLHLFYVGTSLSLIDCVSLLDFADCWVEVDDFDNLIDAVLSHQFVPRHFALVLGFRVFGCG